MQCEERFYDYIDYVKGKLPHDVSSEIDSHILSCNKCRTEIENIKTFILTLDNYNIKEPDENYFTNLVPVINDRIQNKKINQTESITYDIIFSVVSIIVFTAVLTFTYKVSNQQISTGTFVNNDIELSVDNYNLFGYTNYENIDNNTKKRVAEAIAGILFRDNEDWVSSQENAESYLVSFSDDELTNIIDKLNNTHLLGEK